MTVLPVPHVFGPRIIGNKYHTIIVPVTRVEMDPATALSEPVNLKIFRFSEYLQNNFDEESEGFYGNYYFEPEYLRYCTLTAVKKDEWAVAVNCHGIQGFKQVYRKDEHYKEHRENCVVGVFCFKDLDYSLQDLPT